MTNRHPSIEPMHPGELLREDVLPALGIKKGQMADLLQTSRHAKWTKIHLAWRWSATGCRILSSANIATTLPDC